MRPFAAYKRLMVRTIIIVVYVTKLGIILGKFQNEGFSIISSNYC